MIRFFTVGIIGGILFGTMDGIINANPFAQKLFEVYKPIAKTPVNAPAGIVIDLVYGFLIAGIFLMIYRSLPGNSGLIKGAVFGLIAWFFRVVMYAASSWMMFKIPVLTLSYIITAGLFEMLILGIFYGLTLKPAL